MSRLVGTLLFCALYPLAVYAELLYLHNAGVAKFSLLGVGIPLAMQLLGCLVAWLIVRPQRIRWFTRPWWGYALLAAGFVAKAWTLPLREAVFGLVFYILAVGFAEEFIYRGCLEEGAARLGPTWSWVVVGIGFGVVHAPVAILGGDAVLTAILSSLGGGVLGQFAYRFVRDKAGLGAAVGVHGLFDFMGT